MNMRLPGICRWYRAALLTVTAPCLIIVSAAAQETESETESDAAEAFVETFDDSPIARLEGWCDNRDIEA